MYMNWGFNPPTIPTLTILNMHRKIYITYSSVHGVFCKSTLIMLLWCKHNWNCKKDAQLQSLWFARDITAVTLEKCVLIDWLSNVYFVAFLRGRIKFWTPPVSLFVCLFVRPKLPFSRNRKAVWTSHLVKT